MNDGTHFGEVTEFPSLELAAAGIDVVQKTPKWHMQWYEQRELSDIGRFESLGRLGHWWFQRARDCWVADASTPHGMPRDLAILFNRIWYNEVLVGKSVAPPDADEKSVHFAGITVRSYVFTTQRGLNAFAALIKAFAKE